MLTGFSQLNEISIAGAPSAGGDAALRFLAQAK